MAVYTSLDILLADLIVDSIHGEYLLPVRNVIFHQSIDGFIRLSINSQLGYKISQVCTNFKLQPPYFTNSCYYLENPNNYMGERFISIVDCVLLVKLQPGLEDTLDTRSILSISVLELRTAKRLYKNACLHC